MSALWWAVPAVLALAALALREPRNAGRVLAQAGAVWIGLILVALPLILARS